MRGEGFTPQTCARQRLHPGTDSLTLVVFLIHAITVSVHHREPKEVMSAIEASSEIWMLLKVASLGTASDARGSEAGTGSPGESGIGIKRKDSLEEAHRSVGQSWDCSQVEKTSWRRDVMNWLKDNEAVGRGERGRRKDNVDGRKIKAEGMQSVLEQVVSQAQMKKKEKDKKKVVGWSTKMLDEVRRNREFKDTDEMVPWRNINQELDHLWKVLCGKVEE